MSLRKAAQQALEALQDARQGGIGKGPIREAITSLRAALAEDRPADIGKTSDHFADANKMVATIRPEVTVEPVATISKTETVEPVAWIGCLEGGIEYGIYHKAALKLPDGVRFDLYTAPPKREPLTKEQLLYVYNQLPNWGMDMDSISQDLVAFARAVERAHGIGGEE